MKKKFKIIPVFVPHKGCPHMCSFCNQRYITGHIGDTTPEDVEKTVDMYLSTIDHEKNIIEIAFFGGSFTAIDIAEQTALLKRAKEYKDAKRVDAIRLSTRPDAVGDDILENLELYGVSKIELGVQSMCDDVLIKNGRGHTADDVRNAVARIRKYGFELGLQMMTGLIGSDDEKDIKTAEEIIALKPDFVRIYPTLVFENTELYERYRDGSYKPQTVLEAARLSAKLLDMFEKNGIKVIRVGLLVTEDEAKHHLKAGPYHPRFRELVNSYRVY